MNMKEHRSFPHVSFPASVRFVAAAFTVSFLLPLLISGCGTVFRSRVILDSYSTRHGMSIRNFPVDEADSFVRFFVIERGYGIRFADSSEDLVQKELKDEDASLLWIAEKPGEPLILFLSSEKALQVVFVETAAAYPSRELTERAQVLSRILAAKYGRENVRVAGPRPDLPDHHPEITGR